MSEFDEFDSSQDFEETAMADVEFSEVDELQNEVPMDSMESVDVGYADDVVDSPEVDIDDFQDYEATESFSENVESSEDYYEAEDMAEEPEELQEEAEDMTEEPEELQEAADDIVDESQLSPAELKELADQETAEAQSAAEEWADSNGYDTWSDGTPRQAEEFAEDVDNIREYQDESQLSPAELKELADQETAEAQREAEEWADSGGANVWSDGTIRKGHENDTYYRTTNEL